MSKRRSPKNFLSGKAFTAHRKEMLESPAWRALSINARRLLDRLEVEHMAHGGAENGRLMCTRDQLQAWGVRRQSISPALAEVEALGFMEITRRGFVGAADVHDRLPSHYRLTYVIESRDYAPPPTDEWRRFSSDEAAEAAVKAALTELEARAAHTRQQREARELEALKVGAAA